MNGLADLGQPQLSSAVLLTHMQSTSKSHGYPTVQQDLPLLHMVRWLLSSWPELVLLTKKEAEAQKNSCSLGSDATLHHFYHILLDKESHSASQNLRSKRIISTFLMAEPTK